MELSPQYNPKETEGKVYKLWEESGFFSPDNFPKKEIGNFCVVVPPPNITGSLHMGHALNAVVQDILIRKKRMEGYKTLWLPGTDHAGIATQNAVEKELKKQGVSRHDLGREKFIEKIWEWKEKYGGIILEQFKKLGASMDWSRARFTMDDGYKKAVEEAFFHYYKKRWIYRAERVINWCFSCQTSLSDLELEYKEEKTKLYWIKYGPFILATTRPETKLGDTAVAVHPDDKRYKDMVGKTYEIPGVLGKFKIKVVADRTVDPEFGSGAIKVTPSHSIVDSEIAERHNLPFKKIIDEKGRMMKNCGKYAGLKTFEAREEIVKDMEKMGLIDRIDENYIHNIAICYRCGSVIENLPSLQWFLKMEELAKLAAKAVKTGKVKFHPPRWEKIYLEWLKNVKDWCVSRQIWWGHQLPVFYCGKKLEEFKIQNSPPKADPPLAEKFKIKEDYFIVSNEQPEVCPFCKSCQMEQSADVLDTWFSSALWPFATLGWPDKNHKDLKEFYPTQVLSTARDIINLWVARMIFSGMEFMKEPPFSDVIIHATILTKDGKRMSKSLGTGVDPMNLIEKYGVDAVRFGLIWQSMGGQDIHWAEEHVMAGRKFCNKLWNAARFVGQNAQDTRYKIQDTKPITDADKQIIAALEKTKKGVNEQIEKYEFGQALHDLYDFFWHEFCDIYIERAKSQIADPQTQKITPEILVCVLSESLKLLHPFMPFITEEIWSKIPLENKNLLIIETWPK